MSAGVTDVDFDALKERLRATWMAGDYDRFSRFMESSAVEFLDRVGITPGASLLDDGPTNRAFAALTAHDQEALQADLVALWRAHNQSSLANRTAVDAEYLQVVAIRSKQ